MQVLNVTEKKRDFLPLLLLADESELMINRYLDRGILFVLQNDAEETVGVCVVTEESEDTIEIKNLAIVPEFQRQGWGKFLINHVRSVYRGQFKFLRVGTGESPTTLPFYEKCGFKFSHRIQNFFTDNYDRPIIEDGVKLVDMIVLEQTL